MKQGSDLNVSTKKPLAKTLTNKQMLYGRFVKVRLVGGWIGSSVSWSQL